MRAPSLALVLMIVACCSPYQYGNEVKKFSDGVDSLSTAFKEASKAVVSDYAVRQQVVFSDKRPRIRLTGVCGASAENPPDAGPCELVPLDGTFINEKIEEVYRAQQQRLQVAIVKTGPVLDALRKYADSMKVITSAADRKDFDAASDNLTQSVTALSAALSVATSGASVIIPAIVKGGTFLLGESLDAERRETLLAQTRAVQPHIGTVAKVLGEGLDTISIVRQGFVNETARQVVTSLDDSVPQAVYRVRLTEAQNLVSELNALRHAKPKDVASQMADAHAKLVAALEDPERNFSTLLDAVDKFAGSAKELRDAFSTPAKS